ncbi:hypothetical protein BD410DRAFT_836639 [Rickenella mellea]|uniref:Shelterin complex subunit TPP1/Est3 domain-containing protein n=1 Tax=Rickenella mellea TaxID=50990 RepID=A0A4Y7QF02_9AGAM|nr:hypothetical protein BD410DRAFT_836639 [Rickenella mellea]
MSESLDRAWILKYFTEIAANYSHKVSDAPVYPRTKRAQITEFITFPHSPNDTIWAWLSDKWNQIPVVFTPAAMSEYALKEKRRLTDRGESLVLIGSFRPIFVRIPLKGKGKEGQLDPAPRLALEIGSVNVVGARAEGLFGNPKDLEAEPDIYLWVKEMRENVNSWDDLNHAKEERELPVGPEKDKSPQPAPQIDSPVTPSKPKASKQTSKKTPQTAFARTPQPPAQNNSPLTCSKRKQTSKKTPHTTFAQSPHPAAQNDSPVTTSKRKQTSKKTPHTVLAEPHMKPAERAYYQSWKHVINRPFHPSEEMSIKLLGVLKFGAGVKSQESDTAHISDALDLGTPPPAPSVPANKLPSIDPPKNTSPLSPNTKLREGLLRDGGLQQVHRSTTPSEWESSDKEDAGGEEDEEETNLDDDEVADDEALNEQTGLDYASRENSDDDVQQKADESRNVSPVAGQGEKEKEDVFGPMKSVVSWSQPPSSPTRQRAESQSQTQSETQSSSALHIVHDPKTPPRRHSRVLSLSSSPLVHRRSQNPASPDSSLPFSQSSPHFVAPLPRDDVNVNNFVREPRILVPDSDTSGTASQSQSQGLSQLDPQRSGPNVASLPENAALEQQGHVQLQGESQLNGVEKTSSQPHPQSPRHDLVSLKPASPFRPTVTSERLLVTPPLPEPPTQQQSPPNNSKSQTESQTQSQSSGPHTSIVQTTPPHAKTRADMPAKVSSATNLPNVRRRTPHKKSVAGATEKKGNRRAEFSRIDGVHSDEAEPQPTGRKPVDAEVNDTGTDEPDADDMQIHAMLEATTSSRVQTSNFSDQFESHDPPDGAMLLDKQPSQGSLNLGKERNQMETERKQIEQRQSSQSRILHRYADNDLPIIERPVASDEHEGTHSSGHAGTAHKVVRAPSLPPARLAVEPPSDQFAASINATTGPERELPRGDDFIVRTVKHDAAAWETASFVRNRKRPRKEQSPLPLVGESSTSITVQATRQIPLPKRRRTSPNEESVQNKNDSDAGQSTKPTKPSQISCLADNSTDNENAMRTAANKPHKASTKGKGKSIHRKTAESSGSTGAQHSANGSVEGPNKSLPNYRPKFGGFIPDLELRREEGGPQWLNWADTVSILLSIGRHRNAQNEANAVAADVTQSVT